MNTMDRKKVTEFLGNLPIFFSEGEAETALKEMEKRNNETD